MMFQPNAQVESRVSAEQKGGGVFIMSTQTSEDGYFIPPSCRRLSAMIDGMIESEEPGTLIALPVLSFNNYTLSYVAHYLNFYATNEQMQPTQLPKPFVGDMKTICNTFDYEFFTNVLNVKENFNLTVSILNAANFLGTVSLVDLSALAVAFSIRGFRPQEVKAKFTSPDCFLLKIGSPGGKAQEKSEPTREKSEPS